ncbi:MAG: hypothetical protein WB445_01950 [Acinetobacter sp.]
MHNFSVLMPDKKFNGDGLMNALQAGACAPAPLSRRLERRPLGKKSEWHLAVL